MIVECYRDAKIYHYDPVELIVLADFNANFVNLVNENNIMIVDDVIVDEYNACTSIDENIKELDNACPFCEQSTVNPKWLAHRQSGHMVKHKTCPACIEESRISQSAGMLMLEGAGFAKNLQAVQIYRHPTPRLVTSWFWPIGVNFGLLTGV